MTSRSSNQNGFMTVMFLLLLGLFLTFAAFALDLGNMYLWQLRLDKASRAGVLAGLGTRGLRGWAAGNQNTGIIENAAQTAVSDNLLTYGFTGDSNGMPQGFTTSNFWNSFDDTMSVSVDYDMPTLLIGRIGNFIGYGFNTIRVDPDTGETIERPLDKLRVTSTQTAQLSRANVVLMLDVSGSMLCPIVDPVAFSGQPPCACRRSADPNACGNSPTKLAAMAQGVTNFVTQFNPNRDRINVIPFNLAARSLFSFAQYRTNGQSGLLHGANLSTMPLNAPITNPTNNATVVAAGTDAWTMLTDVTTLTPALTALAGSNTNHCDALAVGIRELEALSADILGTGPEADRRKLQPFVVFFTDGAPNAMRGIFPNTSINAGGDFYHYALEWVVPNTTNPTLPPFTYRGPAPFVLRTSDANTPEFVQPLFRFPIASGSVAPTGSITCGGAPQPNFWQFEQTLTNNTSGGQGGRGAAGGCLTNTTFRFAIPFTDFDAEGNQLEGNYQAQVQNVPISTATTAWRDPNWPTANPTIQYGLQKYDELPYYCAIEAADYLRLHFGATIFAIGLGPTNAHSINNLENNPNCNDPLMDADDHSGRKDFFLSRLAFSRQIFGNQLLPTTIGNHYQVNVPQTNRTVTQCTRHRYQSATAVAPPNLNIGYISPATNHSSSLALKSDNLADAFKALRPFRPLAMDFNNGGTNGFNFRRIDTMGEYFPTNNPNDVPSIFSNIAKTILLRSTS